MLNLSAAVSAAGRLSLGFAAIAWVAGAAPAAAMWNQPWKDESRALVIDAYEFNPINWAAMTADERIAAFVSKASDGLPPSWTCRGLDGDDRRLCQNRWWKYSVTQELYFTRREMAKMLGLKWGAYHLGRPGNPREQADHFIDFAKPEPDELIALDIEDNDPDEWMSLAEAEVFAEQINIRLGRYPVLYTNGNTAEYISRNADKYPLLSRLPLWYARYRDDITGRFPEETWPEYALWQFASMHNCSETRCPYRVDGTKTDIDVNVSPLTVAELKEAWPFNELVGDEPTPSVGPEAEMLIAELDGTAVTPEPASDELTTLAAYGPGETARKPLDPLQLLTEAAREEQRQAPRPSPLLKALTTSAKRVEPDIPGDAVPRRAPMRTQDVSAGLLDAAGQLGGEMESVRSILRSAESRPAGVTKEELTRAVDETAIARSRIAAELRDSARRQHSSPPAASADGPERQSSVGARETGVSLALSDDRVSSAFSATR